MNKEFLKKLNILYVEDDETIREEFQVYLEKLFNNAIIASDGKEALEKFHKNKDTIDLIVSDINMPRMDGIELLKEIKKHNTNIPFIFTTAYTDEKYLMEGIKNKVSDYFVKPVGLIEMIDKIEKICVKKQTEQKIKNQQKETKEYFDLINKVAIVYMFNNDGTLTYTNDFLNELIGIDDLDNLESKEYKSIFHPDTDKKILEDQWEKIQDGNKWEGKIKYITNQKTAFFTNATIIPIKDDINPNLNKFISINFLTTKEENERRAFKRQLLYNIQEAKKIFRVAQEKIDNLNSELEKYKGYDKKEAQLTKQRIKTRENFIKLQKSEQKIKKIRNRLEQLTSGVNSKINKVVISIKNMKEENERNSKKIFKLKHDIGLREQFIDKIKIEIQEKKSKILNLEDVLNYRTSQLKKKA